MFENELGRIDLLVLDVDGVMTDGKIIVAPNGDEIKEFNVRDGAGIKYWRRAGKKVAIISGRKSQAIAIRARDLGADAVRLDAKDKMLAYEQILQELQVAKDRVAVMGDDLPDLPVMKQCAFPVAVADAVWEVKQAAAYITKLGGGQGCVREVVELILKQSGLWNQILSRYLPNQDRAR